jgi:CelD/BcsL family acetyltransferase involved in cellulose biosynthesis
LFLAWNRTLIYKYSASLPEYLKLRPNNLLLWHAMRWGCENGFHTFDFGRSDADNHGLRKFKSGWGALERPLAYTTVADHPVARGSGRLLHLAGPVIRRSPPWVCRAAGELLYKYAA